MIKEEEVKRVCGFLLEAYKESSEAPRSEYINHSVSW